MILKLPEIAMHLARIYNIKRKEAKKKCSEQNIQFTCSECFATGQLNAKYIH